MREYSKQRKSLPWGTIISSALFSIVLVGGALYFSGYDIFRPFGAFNGKNAAFSDLGDSPAIGRPDAPVTVVVFADFQCPTCAIFHFGAQEAIINTYVKRGAARLVFRHFPIIGDESFFAAYASECAREQGKFWEYQDALFEKRSQTEEENSGMFSRNSLIAAAERIGMEKGIFERCIASDRYRDAVVRDVDAGKEAGVQGTPTIFINGEKFEGLVSFDTYKEAIEKIINK